MLFIIGAQKPTLDRVMAIARDASLSYERHESLDACLKIRRKESPSCILCGPSVLTSPSLKLLHEEAAEMVVVPVLGASDASNAVRGLRCGAFDCLVEPLTTEEVLSIIEKAIAESSSRIERSRLVTTTRQAIASLTERELEVVPLICDGLSNKQVAARLDISIKTVAHHRSQILKKTAARNTAHMVQLVTIANSLDSAAVNGRH